MTVVLAVGHGHRAARAMHRYLTEGKAYLDEEDAMEDIVNNLGVFDKNENVGIVGGLHREHQPKINGAERARTTRKSNWPCRKVRQSGKPNAACAVTALPCWQLTNDTMHLPIN